MPELIAPQWIRPNLGTNDSPDDTLIHNTGLSPGDYADWADIHATAFRRRIPMGPKVLGVMLRFFCDGTGSTVPIVVYAVEKIRRYDNAQALSVHTLCSCTLDQTGSPLEGDGDNIPSGHYWVHTISSLAESTAANSPIAARRAAFGATGISASSPGTGGLDKRAELYVPNALGAEALLINNANAGIGLGFQYYQIT